MSKIEKKLIVATFVVLLVLAIFAPMKANAATSYDLFIGNELVTSENASDVLGDGTVSYDASSNTLTLNNATITGGGDDNFGYGIYYAGTDNFTLISKGTNDVRVAAAHKEYSVGLAFGEPVSMSSIENYNITINIEEGSTLNISGGYVSDGYYPTSMGILNARSKGNMTIKGKGNLNVRGNMGSYSYGICSNGDIHFNGSGEATISTDSATSYCFGVHAPNNRISSGTLNVSSGSSNYSYGFYSDAATTSAQNAGKGNLTIDGGHTIITSGRGTSVSIGAYADVGIQIEGGTVEISTIQQEGNSKAINKAPTISNDMLAVSSELISGDNPVEYKAENNATYKWFKAPAQSYRITFDFNGAIPKDDADSVSDPIFGGTELYLDTFPELIANAPEGKDLDGFEVNGKRYEKDGHFTLNSDVTVKYLWKESNEEQEDQNQEQPNQKEYTITNGDYTVIFTYDEGHDFELDFDDVLKMTPEQLNELGVTQEQFDQLLAIIKNNVKDYNTLLCVYAIEIYEGRLGYGGQTKIKIKMSDEMKNYNSFKIIYLDDENNFKVGEIVELEVDGEYIVGTLPHLSAYALVGTPTEKTEEAKTDTVSTEGTNPKTGDSIFIWISSLIVSASAMTILKKKI